MSSLFLKFLKQNLLGSNADVLRVFAYTCTSETTYMVKEKQKCFQLFSVFYIRVFTVGIVSLFCRVLHGFQYMIQTLSSPTDINTLEPF